MSEKKYKDHVTVTGETFNGSKFEHKLYYQNGASEDDVLAALRAREPSAQRESVKIEQGPTNEELVKEQKKLDEARAHYPKVVEPKAESGKHKK